MRLQRRGCRKMTRRSSGKGTEPEAPGGWNRKLRGAAARAETRGASRSAQSKSKKLWSRTGHG